MSRLVGLFSFTACALQANAFLLPPNIAESGDGAIAFRLTSPVSATNAVVQLPCAECAVSASPVGGHIEDNEDEPLFWIQGGAQSVLVNFTLSDDRQRLQVNGETIYPLGLLEADMFGSPRVYIDQVRSGASVADIEAGTEEIAPVEVTGQSITIRQQGNDMLIPIEYAIYELENQPVSLDVITVSVLDLPEGLMIVSAESEAPAVPRPDDFFGPPPEDFDDFLFPPPPPELEDFPIDEPQFGKDKECNMLPAALCKLRNIIDSKLMGLGRAPGCHGRKGGKPHGGRLPTHIKGPHFRPGPDDREPPHHHRPHFRPEEGPHRPHHHGRPHHMRPHHHDHHGHHFMHAFSRGLAAVLVPTMAGIAVGMTASLVGLIVGRIIGFLWIKLYRGGRRGYTSVSLSDDTVNEVDVEKEVTEEESLPAYEPAPAYEEKEIVEETR